MKNTFFLKAYRAYKWGSKMPQCAAQILCTVNQRTSEPVPDTKANESFRSGLTKVASFPAAWAISNKSGLSFWSLYASILEANNCLVSPSRFLYFLLFSTNQSRVEIE